LVDPTRNIRKALGRHAAALPEPTIDGRGVAVAEALDHHIQGHDASPKKQRAVRSHSTGQRAGSAAVSHVRTERLLSLDTGFTGDLREAGGLGADQLAEGLGR